MEDEYYKCNMTIKKKNENPTNIDQDNDDFSNFGQSYFENDDNSKINTIINIKDIDGILDKRNVERKTFSNILTQNTQKNEQINNDNEHLTNNNNYTERDNQYFKNNNDNDSDSDNHNDN